MTLITQMSTYETVKTELNTNWNTGVIGKPTFRDGFLGDISSDPPEVLIGWSGVDFFDTDHPNGVDRMENPFEIVITSLSLTDNVKILSEVRRICNNKAIDDGYWHMDNAIPFKHGGMHGFLCIVKEIIWRLGD